MDLTRKANRVQWRGVLDGSGSKPFGLGMQGTRSGCITGGVFKMRLASSSCQPDETVPTAECLLKRVKEVRGVLRGRGFSSNVIDKAVTVLHCAALPYINGTKVCKIKNRRAWAFKVGIQAAKRAAKREVRLKTVEPAILAAMAKDTGPGEELFDIADVLKQLTEKQRTAIELCVLKEVSKREAAKEMGIAASTLCGHYSAAKERLREIVRQLIPASVLERYDASADASYRGEKEMLLSLTFLPRSATGTDDRNSDEYVLREHYDPSACASYTEERGIGPLLTFSQSSATGPDNRDLDGNVA